MVVLDHGRDPRALVRRLAEQVVAEERPLRAAGAPEREPTVFALPLRGPETIQGVLVLIRTTSGDAPPRRTRCSCSATSRT